MTRQRVVFDTTTVVSALLFANGRLAWLRHHWNAENCHPLVSAVTVAELTRVLAYPKFRLSSDDRNELLAEYLPSYEIVKPAKQCSILCRDPDDQPFLDLAESGNATLLVTGNQDLLALAGQTAFLIETPEAYRTRVSP
ncbi:MAG: putative toxin-antitoxin system toxin component, PIN family [Edaphobacter sp.]